MLQRLDISRDGAGCAAGFLAWRRQQPIAVVSTLGYFTLMEALQAAGYAVVDSCGSPANQSIALLSYLHIAFQPFFINAFALEFVPGPIRQRLRAPVYMVCAASTVLMLMQLYPFEWAGPCEPGAPLCGLALCVESGNRHIGWSIPYNNVLADLERSIGTHSGFPTYMVAAFIMPWLYGAWRFVLFHALLGPIAASLLTDNPREMPAIWCLFSIGILVLALSPSIRVSMSTTTWWFWPRRWRAEPKC